MVKVGIWLDVLPITFWLLSNQKPGVKGAKPCDGQRSLVVKSNVGVVKASIL